MLDATVSRLITRPAGNAAPLERVSGVMPPDL